MISDQTKQDGDSKPIGWEDLAHLLEPFTSFVDRCIDLFPGMLPHFKARTEMQKVIEVSGGHVFPVVLEAMEAALTSREETVKKLAAKDKVIREQERALSAARQSNHDRQNKIKEAEAKLQSKLRACNQDLEKAKKESETVQKEWSAKVQRLHDTVASKEVQLLSKGEAHDLLKLDNAATLEALAISESEVARLQVTIESHWSDEETIETLQKKNEGLQKSLAVAKANQRIENTRIDAAVQRATAPLVKELEALKLHRSHDLEKIRDLAECTNNQQARIGDLQKDLAQSEEICRTTLDQLGKDDAKTKSDEKDLELLAMKKALEEERARTKDLEDRLGPILEAAARAMR